MQPVFSLKCNGQFHPNSGAYRQKALVSHTVTDWSAIFPYLWYWVDNR